MHYYIDGYNYLFCTEGMHSDLHLQRTEFLKRLRKCIDALKLSVTIVFDSAMQSEITRGFLAPLECVYTSQYQTADAYLLSLIEFSRFPSKITLVTSDKALATGARHLGAHTIEVIPFLNWLSGRYAKVQRKERMPLIKAAAKKTMIPAPPLKPVASVKENLCTLFEQRYLALCKEESDNKQKLKPDKPSPQSMPRPRSQKTPKSSLESETARWQRLFEQKAQHMQEEEPFL